MTYADRFKERVCIVTGSSAGIGFAIAKRFALEGGKVVISSRKEDKVNEAVLEIIQAIKTECNDNSGASRVIGVACHVGKATDRENLVKKTVVRFYLNMEFSF